MNVAYVSADPGIPVFGHKGASVHVREFAAALAGAGHRVTIVTPRPGEGDRSGAPFEVHGVVPSHEPQANGPRDRELAAMRLNRRIVDLLVAMHRRDPIDLVYERHALFSAAGAGFTRLTGVPLVLEVNAPLLREQLTWRGLVLHEEARWIERCSFDAARLIVAVSTGTAAYVARRTGRPERIRVLPNGVDLSLYRSLPPKPPSDRFTVGFLGSLKPWHGIDVLCDAFRTLAAGDPRYHLHVVGDGPERTRIERAFLAEGCASTVTLTGAVDKRQVPAELVCMDVAVAPYPALGDFYFSPLKLFDYMAAGRAIVASRIGQIGSILVDGWSGLLARPGDAGDLAEKIRTLRRSRDLAAFIGGNARAEAFRRHGWDPHVRTVESVALPGAGLDGAPSRPCDTAPPERRGRPVEAEDWAGLPVRPSPSGCHPDAVGRGVR
jgi:glycosyltransferase involved in cell wall biosynthesis